MSTIAPSTYAENLSDNLRGAFADQNLQRLRVSIAQYNPEINQDKLNNLLNSDPEGPEVALHKLNSAMFYSKALGYDPDYVYANLPYVSKLWGINAATPKEDSEWWNDNILARSKQTEISLAADKLRETRKEFQRRNGALTYFANESSADKEFRLNGPNGINEWKQKVTEAEENLKVLREAYTPPKPRKGTEWVADTMTGVLQDYISAIASPEALLTGLQFNNLGAGVANRFAQVQTGETYLNLMDAGVDHSTADRVSQVTGVLTGGLEFIQWKTISGGLGLKKILTTAVQNGVKKSTAKIAAEVGKLYTLRVAENWTQNMVEELAQEAVVIAGEEIGKEIGGLPADQKMTGQQILDRLLETAKASAVGMIPLSLFGGSMSARGETKGLIKSGKQAAQVIAKLPNSSPEVRQAIAKAYLSDNELANEFEARQATEPTAFTNDEGPELFYHTTDEGQPVFFRSAEDAAEQMDGRVYASPSEIVTAVQNKYGVAAGEWMQSVFNGKEVLTDAAKAELKADAGKLKEAAAGAQQHQFDFREMTDSQRDTIESLGLNFAGREVVASYIDSKNVWKGTEAEYQALTNKGEYDAWDTGDKVYLAKGDSTSIIPMGGMLADSIRIPTRNGRISTKQTESQIVAVHPETGETIATADYEPGDVIRITNLPEKTTHARQIVKAIKEQGLDYTLDIPQEQRDALLESDPGYRQKLAALAKIEVRQKELAKQAERDMTPEELAAAEELAIMLDKESDAALEALGEYESELLGDQLPITLKDPAQIAEEAQATARRNAQVKAELKTQIIAAAPQLAGAIEPMIMLMEQAAGSRGMTLADWRSRYLADDAFTSKAYAGKRGGVQFMESGEAIIALSSKSDPSTVIHELGHIIRRQLSPSDQAALLVAYEATSWTVDAEERFAEDWETYFTTGKAPTSELAVLFERIARFMRKIYKAIRGRVQPEVQAVIDRAITRQDSEGIQPAQGESVELFQPSKYEQDLLSKEIDLGIKGVLNLGLDVHFGRTSEVLKIAGLPDVEVVMPLGKLLDGMKDPDKKHGHSLTKENYIQLQKDLYDPAYVIVSETIEGAYVIVSDSKDSNGDYIIASIKPAESRRNKANIITSVYGKNNLGRMIKSAFENNLLLYRGLRKEKTLLQTIGLQLPEVTSKVDKIKYKTDRDIYQDKNEILFQPAGDINSPEFKAWFGDSKVVDAKGNPLVVYHGSPDARDIVGQDGSFKSESERYGMGRSTHAHWFTDSLATAKTYADDRRAFDYQNAEPSVIKTYIKLENPLIVEGDYKNWREAQAIGKTTDVIEKAMSEGYDGVIIRNVKDDYNNTKTTKAVTTYVVFSPTQIKSVNNTGVWNPSDPRILYQPAYHGTPHRFDRFTTDAMGTGEGAQAYGWGLYFAGDKDVAEWYRKKLSYSLPKQIKAGGKTYVPGDGYSDGPLNLGSVIYSLLNSVLTMIAQGKTRIEAKETMIEDLKWRVSKQSKWAQDALEGIQADGSASAERMKEIHASLEHQAQVWEEALRTLELLDPEDIKESAGQLYKVEIPNDDEYLDWDKPIGEQGDITTEMKRLGLLTSGTKYNWLQRITGGEAYRQIAADFGSEKEASIAMKKAGIPGIRYLDGLSRSAGEGSYNYVIFDEQDVQIVETFYQPEYTMPSDAQESLERMDQLKAEYETATDERKQEVLFEYRELEKAVSSTVNLWLHTLKKSFDNGDAIPNDAIIQAAEYEAWAQDELAFRRAMDFDPADEIGADEIKTRSQYEAEFLDRLKADPGRILTGIRETMKMVEYLNEQFEAPDEIQQAQMVGMRRLLTGPLWIYVNAKNPDEKIQSTAITSLKNNPSRGMEMEALANGDLEQVAEYRELEAREPLSETAEEKEKAERDRVKKLPFEERVTRLREILKKPFSQTTEGAIETAYAEASRELRRLTTEYKTAVAERKGTEDRYESLSNAYQQNYARLKEIAQELTAIKAQAARTEARQAGEIEALKNRRDELKSELRKIKGQIAPLIQSVKRYEQAKAGLRLEKERDILREYKEAVRKRDDLRRAREYKRQVIKQILKRPAKNVDYRYVIQVKNIQDLLDTTKRQPARMRLERVYEQSPSMIQAIVDAGWSLVVDPPEGETTFTIEQLEAMLEQILILEAEGKALRAEYTTSEAQKVEYARAKMEIRLMEENDPTALGRKTDTGEKKIGLLRQGWQGLEEMQHVLDQLDGGSLDYNGPFWKNVYEPAQLASSRMTAEVNRRTSTLKTIMKDLEIKESELFKTLEVDGKQVLLESEKTTGLRRKKVKTFNQTLQVQTAIGIYMAIQNEQSRKAVTYGNKISESQQQAIIQALPQKYKDLGDAIIEQIFDPDYDRLAEVFSRVNNAQMGKVERYYPMVRQQSGHDQYEQEVSFEAMARAGTKRTPKDGMTKGRVELSERMQTKIRLDAISLTLETIEKQERFIAFIELSKRLNRIFNSRSRDGKPFVDAIEQVRPGTSKQITDWISRVVNRESSRDPLTKAMLRMKMNMSTATMGFNLRTALNSVSGLPLYLGESGPAQLLKATLSSPVKFKSMREKMIALAPEMDRRSIDQAEKISKAHKSLLDMRLSGLRNAGFWLMKEVVTAMDTIGWTAVFENRIAQGMTEQEAAAQATASVLRTQPTGDALAQSDIETQAWAAIITPFASQAYKVWNNYTHLPNTSKEGALKRYIYRVIGQTLGTAVFVGIIPAVTTLALMAAGDPNDEEEKEELLNKFYTSTLSNIPVIGGAIATTAEGYSVKSPLEIVVSPVKVAQSLLETPPEEWEAMNDEEIKKRLRSYARNVIPITGLPFVAIDRIIVASTDDSENYTRRIIHALVGGQL